MESQTGKGLGGDKDGQKTDAVVKLVHAMHMAARKLVSYPEGHPFVVEAFTKVETLLKDVFLSRSQLTLGIAKNKVIMGPKALEEKDPLLQAFAQSLFEHGIVSITISRGFSSQELIDFDHIIAQKRNDVYRQGGINALLTKSKVTHIKTQLIDYRLFQEQGPEAQSDDASGLQAQSFWERFIEGLFEDNLGVSEKPVGSNMTGMDPVALAEILNDGSRKGIGGLRMGAGSGFGTMMRRISFRELAGDKESQAHIFKFMQALRDDLKKRFLEGFFDALSEEGDVVESILSGLPLEVVLEALENQTNKELYMPPSILKVLQRLKRDSSFADHEGLQGFTESLSKDEMVERLKIIFKEDEANRFVPVDYQKALDLAMNKEELSPSGLSEFQQLEQTLTERGIQSAFTTVLVEMVALHGISPLPYALKKAFQDNCLALASRGDFHVLLGIMETIQKRLVLEEKSKEELPEVVAEVFSSNYFIREVLDACEQWGKERQFHIRRIVERVGEPFVEPLMDRLAEEQNKALRLFYLDLLKEIGQPTKNPALERLTDRRWYFLRNLIILLRSLNDPSVTDPMRRLLSYPHPRVRQELLRTLMTFKDHGADEILLAEMDSVDFDRRLQAIALAGMSDNKAVLEKLAGFVKKKGLGKTDYEFKKMAVQSLAEIGDVTILPVLQRVLASFSFFARRRLQMLKTDIISSLGRYNAADVVPVLRAISEKGSGELASEAARVLRTLKTVRHEKP